MNIDPAQTARTASYAADGAVVGIGVLTLQEWAAVVGIVLGLATFAVNWYYQRRRTLNDDARRQMAREAHEHRMHAADDDD